jgi:hypothetical protein
MICIDKRFSQLWIAWFEVIRDDFEAHREYFVMRGRSNCVLQGLCGNSAVSALQSRELTVGAGYNAAG